MDYYLDINGTLLTNKTFQPAKMLLEFISHITASGDVYWLTTHCRGDAAHTLNYLSRFVEPRVIEVMKDIKPTLWNTLKT